MTATSTGLSTCWSTRDLRKFCEGVTWDQFRDDLKLQLAVEHALQIIGEAAFAITRSRRDAITQIPWPRIIGMRHRLVHDYPRIELPKLWTVVQQHLEPLIQVLEKITPPEPR
jgi:uncharacterized protein with HEPN domain